MTPERWGDSMVHVAAALSIADDVCNQHASQDMSADAHALIDSIRQGLHERLSMLIPIPVVRPGGK